MDEQRMTEFQAHVKTWKTYREDYSGEKVLYLETILSIRSCNDFPILNDKDVFCKQFFLFPERYVELKIGDPVIGILPYYRIEDFLKENVPHLNVTFIELDTFEATNQLLRNSA